MCRRWIQLGALYVKSPRRATMVLATFAETKVARLPGRTPAKLQLGMVQHLSLKIYWERRG
jgi:hypothetical protein